MCKYANMWIQLYYFYYCTLNSLIAKGPPEVLRLALWFSQSFAEGETVHSSQ